MHGSATVGWMLAALCLYVAVVCLLRARDTGGMRRRTAANEALMGLGMAGMALPVEGPAPSPLVLLALFGAVGLRELALLLREARRDARTPYGPGRAERCARRHHLHHLVGAAAMIYMVLAMPAGHGSAAGAGGHAAAAASGLVPALPVLTGGLLVYYAVHVLRGGLELLPAPASGAFGGTGAGSALRPAPIRRTSWEAPGVPAACRVAMGTGMLTMLLTL